MDASDSMDRGTIRLQAVPVRTLKAQLDNTAIARFWTKGDTARCRLCETCTADHDIGFCLVITDEAVSDGGATLYSTCGTDVIDPSSLTAPTLRPPAVLALR